MSTPKHTPGPWKNSLTGIQTESGRLIAQAWCGERNDSFGNIPAVGYPEMMANAKLIAAAPELLDAILLLREYGETPDVIEACKAAIKKATE